jgi:hypothetical protein
MNDASDRIAALDLRLFESIASQSSPNDRKALLLLQNCARSGGKYAYLEIGSFLGGSIQPHYVDPLCHKIYSIDKRPASVPDERGKSYAYEDNSAEKMRSNLRAAFGPAGEEKLEVFDADASDLDVALFVERPVLCFIDGEHTNSAARKDFDFCHKVVRDDGMIAFHDTLIVYAGILKIKSELKAAGVRFEGLMLPGSVYVILLNDAVDRCGPLLKPHAQNEKTYFRHSRSFLWQTRLQHRSPAAYRLLMLVKKMLGRG